ncbi:hypothetical protein [Streptomyces sp. NPDC017260]
MKRFYGMSDPGSGGRDEDQGPILELSARRGLSGSRENLPPDPTPPL